jgi:hypothetical protein
MNSIGNARPGYPYIPAYPAYPYSSPAFRNDFGKSAVESSTVAPPHNRNDEPDAIPLENLSPAEQDLQKRFPGHYARLAPSRPFSRLGPSVSGATHALDKWRHHIPAQDHELASLNGVGTLMGSALIATLATLGMRQRILGVPEFLGLVSWFTAMSLTPKAIDGLTLLKTGVNLERTYDSSYGERKNLFSDPHYLPLHLLPESAVNRAAKRMHIPAGAPDRRERVEDKIRQVSVQARTWWMLAAGPAAAVISGLLCDMLETGVMASVNRLRKALFSPGPDASPSRVDAALACRVGHRPESDLSRWWKDFSDHLVRRTSLHANPDLRLPLPERERIAETIARHMTKLSTDPARLADVKHLLEERAEVLHAIKTDAEHILETVKPSFNPTEWAKRNQWLQDRIFNAKGTLDHYRSLLHTLTAPGRPLSDTDIPQIRAHMETGLPVLQSLLRNGFHGQAHTLTGDEDAFRRIATALQQERNGQAAEWMGASPMGHLIDSIRETLLRKRWQNRMLRNLGGSLLALTALYIAFFVGRDFSSKASNATPSPKTPKPPASGQSGDVAP